MQNNWVLVPFSCVLLGSIGRYSSHSAELRQHGSSVGVGVFSRSVLGCHVLYIRDGMSEDSLLLLQRLRQKPDRCIMCVLIRASE